MPVTLNFRFEQALNVVLIKVIVWHKNFIHTLKNSTCVSFNDVGHTHNFVSFLGKVSVFVFAYSIFIP